MLQFIRGTGAFSKESVLIDTVSDWLSQGNEYQVFYLVPNNIKFETEVKTLKNLFIKCQTLGAKTTNSSMQLQVFSFSRLAWYYLQGTSLYNQKTLSEVGKTMLVQKLIQENKEELSIYRGETNKSGFIEKVTQQLEEFITQNLTLEDLAYLITELKENTDSSDTAVKLEDLTLIYDKFLSAIQQSHFTEDLLTVHLADYLDNQNLSKVMFVFDGYSQLSSDELYLMNVLLRNAGKVVVGLTVDQAYVQNPPATYDLFYETGNLYYHIYQLARNYKVPIFQDIVVGQQDVVVSPQLEQLDRFWQNSRKLTTSKIPISQNTDSTGLEIWQAENAVAEINHIAKKIRHLVVEEGYRYQDIQVFSRNLEYYDQLIQPVFDQNEIPYYLDEDSKMRQHPLVEFLDALFTIKTRYYRYQDVMRFLRTELFLPQIIDADVSDWQSGLKLQKEFRNQVDITENVVLAYGYEGKNWTQANDWKYIPYNKLESEVDQVDLPNLYQKISNNVRRTLISILEPFFDQLNHAKTAEEAASFLYFFLERSGVKKQLLFWRDQEIEQGNLDSGRIHEQTWQALVDLLDEYVSIFQDVPFDIQEFQSIFAAGLEEFTYSKIPTTLDQVAITSADLLPGLKKKVVFFIGLTDQALPKKIEETSLLSTKDRLQVNEYLVDDKTQQPTMSFSNSVTDLAREPFLAYQTFLTASEKLFLTYPITQENSEDSKISPYVKQIAEGMKLNIQFKPLEFDLNTENQITEISTYRMLLQDLVVLKRQALVKNQNLPSFWHNMEQLLLANSNYQAISKQVFASVHHLNVPQTLTNSSISALYGKKIYTSVSQIESFYECEYKYFLRYGLRLKEREIFGLSSQVTGEFFHEALDTFFKELICQDLHLVDLNETDLLKLTDNVLQQVFGQDYYLVLTTSQRMEYIRYQLANTIKKISWGLKQQSRRTGMSVQQTEVVFGQIAQAKGKRLDGLSFPIDPDKSLIVRGKIDRVDAIEVEGSKYIGVVDYKSSKHKFDFRDAYFGLAMQMITYLDVALKNAVQLTGTVANVAGEKTDKVKAAGAFYLQVQNPILKPGIDVATQVLENYRYNGVLINDSSLLERLDYTLDPKDSSLVYPYKKKVDETFSSNSFVSEEQLKGLIHKNSNNFKEAGNKIFAGSVKLNPAYRNKQRIACSYCPFRSVCQFDNMLKENNYHRLDKLSKKEVLDLLGKEGKN